MEPRLWLTRMAMRGVAIVMLLVCLIFVAGLIIAFSGGR